MADDYLENVLREQDAYRVAEPSVIPRTIRRVSKPLAVLTHRLIPAEAVEAVLRGADWAASASIRSCAPA